MLAMVWNAIYNWLFDLALLALGRSLSDRPPGLRVIHTILFELGILIMTLPVVAWWMQISLQQAFLLDTGFMIFYLVYGYVYNWCYDRIFPIPEEISQSC